MSKIPGWALSFNFPEWKKHMLSMPNALFWERHTRFHCENVLNESSSNCIKDAVRSDSNFKKLVIGTINHNFVCAYISKTGDFYNWGCLENGYYQTLKKAEKHFGFCADDLGEEFTWNNVYGKEMGVEI